MKNINRIFIILAVFAGLASCEDEDKTPHLSATQIEQGAFFRNIDNGGTINKNDLAASTYSITGELVSSDISDVASVDFMVAFVDNNTDGAESAAAVLLESVAPSSLTANSDGFPQKTFETTGSNAVSALGIDPVIIDGGDALLFSVVIKMVNGTVFSAANTGDSVRGELFFSSPLDYSATVICVLSEVPAGDWRVEMADSYGDGWQTDDANGGSGITVTLNTGQVFEVGLCSPYLASSFDCTDGVSAGTATITMPSGITSADWFFPGDVYGEISFKIYAPSGNLVATYPGGGPAQGAPIALNLCNE